MKMTSLDLLRVLATRLSNVSQVWETLRMDWVWIFFEMLCGFEIYLKKQDVILYYKRNDLNKNITLKKKIFFYFENIIYINVNGFKRIPTCSNLEMKLTYVLKHWKDLQIRKQSGPFESSKPWKTLFNMKFFVPLIFYFILFYIFFLFFYVYVVLFYNILVMACSSCVNLCHEMFDR